MAAIEDGGSIPAILLTTGTGSVKFKQDIRDTREEGSAKRLSGSIREILKCGTSKLIL